MERALDNARLEIEAQQNTIAHLKAELTERREHERLNQHSIALLDAKMNEKVGAFSPLPKAREPRRFKIFEHTTRTCTGEMGEAAHQRNTGLTR